jgi:D-alanyl-D-alanine carboxypeptidase
MKQFFTVVFGGMLAIAVGIGIAYSGSVAWRTLKPKLASIPAFSLSSAVASAVTPTDGTSISGSKRTIRYTASEEEDLINAAAQALPTASDKRITAKAYLLKNLTRGDVTIEHNADQLLPLASLTKLATAVVARKLISADERVTITRDIMSTYGNTAYFQVGETFKASDLLYPLLMVSSNDAAEAFARDYGRAKFIRAMNDWAQSIGAYRTYFADPSGLSPQNVSTVNDIALMLEWIRKNDPTIIETTALKSKTIRSHTWTNPTHFLSWSYYIGGKNGYTDEANRTGASLFALGKNKNVYAVVVLGSNNRDADVVKLLGKVRE